jgi:hypothetical protein
LGSSFLVAPLVWDLVGLCSSAFDRAVLPGSHLRTAGMWHEMAVFEAVFEHLFTGVRHPGRDQDMDCSLQTPASVSAEATPNIGRAADPFAYLPTLIIRAKVRPRSRPRHAVD